MLDGGFARHRFFPILVVTSFLPRALTCALIVSGGLSANADAELSATFTAGGTTDARLDRLPALLVKAGEPATPFVAAGPFEVTWSGKLTLTQRIRPVFSFEGAGSAALTIDGKPVLEEAGALGAKASERARLNAGDHEITVTFKSQPDGSGRFRLLWEEEGAFPKHAVPPTSFSFEPTDPVKLGELQRQGRELFALNHCAKCHVSGTGFGATPMPETQEFGPLLFSSGDRVTEEWLQRWVATPHTLRPTTRMPELIDGTTEAGRQQAADVALYISTLKIGTPATPAPDPALAARGGETFHTLGCVACHTRPDKTELDKEHPRIPLNNVASKFKPGALFDFIKKPQANHPTTGMPDFGLSDDEANGLAAFLTKASTDKQTKSLEKVPAGDLKRGEEAVKALHCGACHPGLPMAAAATTSALEEIFKKDWSAAGCVAPADKRGKAPKLNLTDAERAALVAFAKVGAAPLSRDTPGEFAKRNVTSQRCVACHANDGHPSLLDTVHSETRPLVADLHKLDERVMQDRPQLTYLGEMLHATVIESMIDGATNPRPRPWLLMRMPAFHPKAKPLAEGFARMHGVEPSGPTAVTVDPAKAEIGRSLAGAKGFGCITCHAIGEEKPTAAFEVEGVNLKLSGQRLREEYFYHWMANPGAVTPSTKMPRYAEGNKSQRGDVLEGDAHQQFEAIWQYLHAK